MQAMRAMRTGGTGRQRLEALDGLRGIAILLVVWCHVTSTAVDSCNHPAAQPGPAAAVYCAPVYFGGTAGVMLFFALSGFLLFLPYAQAILAPERASRSWPSAWGFYVRRMRRILPAYYPVFALLVVLPWLFVAFRFHVPPTQLPWGGFLAGATLVYDLARGPFTTVSVLDGPLWSLTVEWQFYLVLPVLALALRWLAGRGDTQERARRLLLGLVAVMAGGLAARGAAAWAHYDLGYSYPAGGTPGPFGVVFALLYGIRGKYLEVFATGIVASVLYVTWPDVLARIAKHARLLTTVGIVGLALCGVWAATSGVFANLAQAFYWPVSTGGTAVTTWSWTIFGQWATGLCGAVLLLVALGPLSATRWSWSRICRLAPLRGLGLISYSLYLWHDPLLEVVFIRAPFPPFEAAWHVVLGLALAVGFASASYRLIEQPSLVPHPRRRRSTPVPGPTPDPVPAGGEHG